MGQFEKIVVLTVLSLIAVILVISFGTGEDPLAGIDGERGDDMASMAREYEQSLEGAQPTTIQGRRARSSGPTAPAPAELDLADPFDGPFDREGDERLAGTGGELEWPEEPALEVAGRDRLLLSSTVVQEASNQPIGRDPGLPTGSALVSLRGLEDTFDSELKQYTWTRGDSYADLARRYYGGADRAELLRLYNEGREQVSAGETILVPVFDHRQAPPARGIAGRSHLVRDGESLWSISKAEYGKGTDWQRIFEANRDRLASPDDVQAGMELRLP